MHLCVLLAFQSHSRLGHPATQRALLTCQSNASFCRGGCATRPILGKLHTPHSCWLKTSNILCFVFSPILLLLLLLLLSVYMY
jgi:hypothetical protein